VVTANRNEEFGRVEEIDTGIAELGVSHQRQSLHLPQRILRWRPPDDLASHFHSDFSIDFEILIQSDGTRRILPRLPLNRFIDDSFIAGLLLLGRYHGFTPEEDASYRQYKLLFDRVLVMQEHYDRTFGYSRDLYVRRTGRQSDDERHILPVHLGLDADGRGKSWNVTMLCEEGRARARDEGNLRPKKSQVISYGLLKAAELNPLTVPDSEIPSLIRSALFAIPEDAVPPDDSLLQEVYGRLADRFNGHRLKTNDEFDNWFKGKKSNLFKSIGGKTIDQSVVRRAVLELGWRSKKYVSGGLNFLFRAFAATIPNRLNEREKELFAHTFQPQPYLGGLPLILLVDRSQLIAPMINRIWSNPGNPDDVCVLHRLFDYYSTMMRDRRKADVRSKQRNGRVELAVGDAVKNVAAEKPSSQLTKYAEALLRELVKKRQLRCKKCSCFLQAEVIDGSVDNQKGSCRIACRCPEHGGRKTLTVSLEELSRIATELDLDGSDI